MPIFLCLRAATWRPQFRLISLFVAISSIAAISALYGVHFRAMQRQEAAFRKIVEKGGHVLRYEDATTVMFTSPGYLTSTCFPPEEVMSPVTTTMPEFGDQDLPTLDDIIRLDSIAFENSRVSGPEVINFAKTHPACLVSF